MSSIRQQVTAIKTNKPVTVQPVTHLCPAKYSDEGISPWGTRCQKQNSEYTSLPYSYCTTWP